MLVDTALWELGTSSDVAYQTKICDNLVKPFLLTIGKSDRALNASPPKEAL